MSLRGRILIGLISIFCFCLGVTATIMFSPNRSFDAALPHAKTYTFHMRSSSPRWERNYNGGEESFADREMSRTISSLNDAWDQQALLDKLAMQVSRLETTGGAYLGIEMRSGDNCVLVSKTIDDTPADYAFRRGDSIVGIGTFTVTDADSLRRALLTIEPGGPVMVRFYRNGNFLETPVTPATKGIGPLPMSHLALGSAYIKAGRRDDAVKQYNIYASESSSSSSSDCNR